MNQHQIKLVARYAFGDYEPGTLAEALADTIRAFAIPTECEFFSPSLIEQSITAMLVAKGELEE